MSPGHQQRAECDCLDGGCIWPKCNRPIRDPSISYLDTERAAAAFVALGAAMEAGRRDIARFSMTLMRRDWGVLVWLFPRWYVLRRAAR